MIYSTNGRVLCKPYTKSKAIQSTVKSGFSTIQQKQSLDCLEVVVDFKLPDGTEVKKGQFVYFREEDLATFPWSRNEMTSDFTKEKFVLAPAELIVCVK